MLSKEMLVKIEQFASYLSVHCLSRHSSQKMETIMLNRFDVLMASIKTKKITKNYLLLF